MIFHGNKLVFSVFCYPENSSLKRCDFWERDQLRNKTGLIGKFHRWFDWTLGYIFVTDYEIEELYKAVKIGTPIDIKS